MQNPIELQSAVPVQGNGQDVTLHDIADAHGDITEHQLSISDVAKRYHCQFDASSPLNSPGLSSEFAAYLYAAHGPNVVQTTVRKVPVVLQFLHHASDLFSMMLLAAAVISFLLFVLDQSVAVNLWLGVVLVLVILLNASISFFQERKSNAVMEQFQKMLPMEASCIRDGVLNRVKAAELVVGDLIFVRNGERVPADVRVVSTSSLKVDNASLTGESEPQDRCAEQCDPCSILEAQNLLFSGTFIVSGEGYCIVLRTGSHTMLGSLAMITAAESKLQSSMSKEINTFVKRMGAVAVISSVALFIYAILNGYALMLSFLLGIGMIVAWVPQGLPATVNMLLSITAKRLAENKVLVKDLLAVETLGRVTCICSDKTGTLTQNKMTVIHIWMPPNRHYTVGAAGHGHVGVASEDTTLTVCAQDGAKSPEIMAEIPKSVSGRFRAFENTIAPSCEQLVSASALCSYARFARQDTVKPLTARTIIGDATEAGLLRFAAGQGAAFALFEKNLEKLFEVPFNSERKWYMVVYRNRAQPSGLVDVMIKGAPERVFNMCNEVVDREGEARAITDTDAIKFKAACETIAGHGLRILGFAEQRIPDRQLFDPKYKYKLEDMPTTGCGLLDPPKPDVHQAVATVRAAGIKMIMVTGDHPTTAESIARDVGIVTRERITLDDLRSTFYNVESVLRSIVIHGDEISHLSPSDWRNLFKCDEVVFARTSPRQKLEIVTRAQASGHIVGVTGDGVNDSPALKCADLGISMGISGSDISKEAAAMVLMDDSFSSIVVGIRQGRLIFENLKKSIAYSLTHLIAEMLPVLFNVMLGIPLPMLPLCILAIDLGTELIPAISFAYEDQEDDLMSKKPTVDVLSVDGGDVEAPEPGVALTHEMILTQRNKRQRAEHLVDNSLILYSYLWMGLIETIGAVCAYLLLFYSYGLTPASLYGTASEYFLKDSPDLLVDGHRYDADRQLSMLSEAQSAYFIGIVVMQVIHLFLVKTRRIAVRMRHVLKLRNLFSVISSVAICCAVVYVPFLQMVVGTQAVPAVVWTYPLIGGVLMIMYDYMRKSCCCSSSSILHRIFSF